VAINIARPQPLRCELEGWRQARAIGLPRMHGLQSPFAMRGSISGAGAGFLEAVVEGLGRLVGPHLEGWGTATIRDGDLGGHGRGTSDLTTAIPATSGDHRNTVSFAVLREKERPSLRR